MIGMGPFIPHEATPLGSLPCPDVEERLRLSFLMIAATRLKLRDVNIADNRLAGARSNRAEKGLRFGANIVMPQITPPKVRRDYLLYPSKPCLDDNAEACRAVSNCASTALTAWWATIHGAIPRMRGRGKQ